MGSRTRPRNRHLPHVGRLLAGIVSLGWSAVAVAEPRVVTSIGPVHSLTAAVMEGLGEPVQLVRGYGSPHAYQMRPSEAAHLRDADLVLWIGPPMETFLIRPLAAARGTTRVVALFDVPGLRLIESHRGRLRGDHGDADAHGQEAFRDAHIWLSPRNAKVMASAIARELRALDPENGRAYEANLEGLVRRIDSMERRIDSRLAPVRTVPYVVFHDAFRYFEESFGLHSVGAVTLSPDRMPSARRIKELREEIARSGARCVFREPQFEAALIQILVDDSGARTGVLDPLGTQTARGPNAYFEMMEANADALVECLGR